MKYVPVDPDEIDNLRQGRRGRISYPILKGFLETGMYIAKLDLTGIQQNKPALSSSMNTYIRNHNLPIKLFQRSGDMYLVRLDIDESGKAIPDWEMQAVKKVVEGDTPEEPITPAAVSKNYGKEKVQVTK
jgi:hypothetical protein